MVYKSAKLLFSLNKKGILLLSWLMLVVGVFEGIGMSLVLPIISSLNTSADTDNIPEILKTFLSYLNLSVKISNLLILFLAIILVKAALVFVTRMYAIRMALAYDYLRIKRELFSNYLLAEWAFVKRHPSSIFTNNILVEATRAKDVFVYFAELFKGITLIIAYIAVAMYISIDLILVTVFIAIFIASIYVILFRFSRKLGERLTQLNHKAQHLIGEAFQGIKYIKSVNAISKFIQLYEKHLNGLKENQMRFSILTTLSKILSEPFSLIVLLSTVVVAQYKGVSFEVLIAFNVILFRMYQSLSHTMITAQTFNNVMPSVEACEYMRRISLKAKEYSKGASFEKLSGNVVFEDISFGYDNQLILDQVNIVFEQKCITALQGPSGTGKTTIIDLLLGLHKPTSGIIRLGEIQLDRLDINTLRSKIGLVPQEPIIFDDTVVNNIRLQRPDASMEEVEAAAKDAFAHDFILKFKDGYETVLGERGNKLSGGQKQRIALARALIIQPEILILDEATSALDHESEKQIQKSLEILHSKLTIIIIAHRATTIQNADIVYYIDNGTAQIVN